MRMSNTIGSLLSFNALAMEWLMLSNFSCGLLFEWKNTVSGTNILADCIIHLLPVFQGVAKYLNIFEYCTCIYDQAIHDGIVSYYWYLACSAQATQY